MGVPLSLWKRIDQLMVSSLKNSLSPQKGEKRPREFTSVYELNKWNEKVIIVDCCPMSNSFPNIWILMQLMTTTRSNPDRIAIMKSLKKTLSWDI